MIARNTIRPVMKVFMLCCVIGFASGSASADRGSSGDLTGNTKSARDKGAIFDLFDKNGDQRVDRAEFRVGIIDAFEMFDTNLDNALSRAELPSVMSSAFDRADHNDDGRLSAFEFVDSDFMKFSRFDLNKDGFITHQ